MKRIITAKHEGELSFFPVEDITTNGNYDIVVTHVPEKEDLLDDLPVRCRLGGTSLKREEFLAVIEKLVDLKGNREAMILLGEATSWGWYTCQRFIEFMTGVI